MSIDWDAILRRFSQAQPHLVECREMQRRAESKFAMPVSAAAALLPALAGDYALLSAGAARIATYRTLYFDTAELELFHAHRCGRRIRHKVRIRHYEERSVSFLEVKTRLREDQTRKARRPRAFGDSVFSPEDVEFVRVSGACHKRLFPQVWTNFRRVTLLGTHMEERVTIDLDVSVSTGGRAQSLTDLAVVEVKQARLDRGSVAMEALREAGWREGWGSKYCAGIALTRPEVRAQHLTPEMRAPQAEASCPS